MVLKPLVQVRYQMKGLLNFRKSFRPPIFVRNPRWPSPTRACLFFKSIHHLSIPYVPLYINLLIRFKRFTVPFCKGQYENTLISINDSSLDSNWMVAAWWLFGVMSTVWSYFPFFCHVIESKIPLNSNNPLIWLR